MLTLIVLSVIAVLWYLAGQEFMKSGDPSARRRKSALGFSFVGGTIGSFFGIAGFGGAIIGTIPGTVFGYVLGSYLMMTDHDR